MTQWNQAVRRLRFFLPALMGALWLFALDAHAEARENEIPVLAGETYLVSVHDLIGHKPSRSIASVTTDLMWADTHGWLSASSEKDKRYLRFRS